MADLAFLPGMEPPPPALEPLPPRPWPGEFRGDLASVAAVAADVEVFCGAAHGWRPLGTLLSGGERRAVVVQQHGRLLVGLTFDVGEAGHAES